MKNLDGKNHFIWLTAALVGMMITGAVTTEFPESSAFQTLEHSSIVLLLLSLIGRSMKTGIATLRIVVPKTPPLPTLSFLLLA